MSKKLQNLLDMVVDCCTDELKLAKENQMMPSAAVLNTAMGLIKQFNVTPDVDDTSATELQEEFKEAQAIARAAKAAKLIADAEQAANHNFLM